MYSEYAGMLLGISGSDSCSLCWKKNVFSDELFSFVIGGNGRMVGTSNNSVHVSPTGFDGD